MKSNSFLLCSSNRITALSASLHSTSQGVELATTLQLGLGPVARRDSIESCRTAFYTRTDDARHTTSPSPGSSRDRHSQVYYAAPTVW